MHVVVIGTGPAGITAAETLRRLDPHGSVTALSAEPFPPYSPVALADHLLTGREGPLFWKGQDAARRLGIEERRGAVVRGVDTDNREVVLDDGARLAYEGLVVASGSRLHAPLEGADLPGILDFKSLSTARSLLARVRSQECRTALVVGNGFIGVELSLLLADLGVDTTIVGRRSWLMPRALDRETSAIAEAAVRARGVTLRLGVEATAFIGNPANGVRLADGRALTADLVLAATGVKPHIGHLADSAIQTDWGVLVDDSLRTSAPGVVAAGDVAVTRDYMTGERYVHAIFHNAVRQAPIAAANLLGAQLTYEGAEAMNSLKHLGVPIVAVGSTDNPDAVLRWGDGQQLRSVYLRDGRITGAQLAGNIRSIGIYRSLMRRRIDVSPFGHRLVEPRFGLADLLFDVLP